MGDMSGEHAGQGSSDTYSEFRFVQDIYSGCCTFHITVMYPVYWQTCYIVIYCTILTTSF